MAPVPTESARPACCVLKPLEEPDERRFGEDMLARLALDVAAARIGVDVEPFDRERKHG